MCAPSLRRTVTTVAARPDATAPTETVWPGSTADHCANLTKDDRAVCPCLLARRCPENRPSSQTAHLDDTQRQPGGLKGPTRPGPATGPPDRASLGAVVVRGGGVGPRRDPRVAPGPERPPPAARVAGARRDEIRDDRLDRFAGGRNDCDHL